MTNQPAKPAKPTKLTPYALTKRMNEALIKEYQRCERDKKTEQKILYILNYVNKKEVKKFKRDYIKFIIRYKPKTKREELLKMSVKIMANFEDMKRYLITLINIKSKRKNNKINLIEPFTKDYLIKNINSLLNLYLNTLYIMKDYIGRYKAVSRGRWANEDIILRNLRKLPTFVTFETYNSIKTTCARVLTKIDKFKKYFLDLLEYYEEHRREKYENKLKIKAPEFGKRFEKMILKGIFLSLVGPIFNGNDEKPNKVLLTHMYNHTKEIYNEKFKNIQEIKNKLISPTSQLTNYEIIYSLYFKNM